MLTGQSDGHWKWRGPLSKEEPANTSGGVVAPVWHGGERDTLLAALSRAVESQPSALFLRFHGREWTYLQFRQDALSYAEGLKKRGVREGDLIAALVDNGPEAVLFWFAANLIGAVYSPINTSYRGEYLRHQLRDSKARIILTDAKYVERVTEIGAELPDLARVAVIGAADCDSIAGKDVEQVECYREGPGQEQEFVARPTDISCVIYTSGTSGRSKGCALSHNFLCHAGHQFNFFAGRQIGEPNFTALPLFHLNALAGSVVGTMLLGSVATISSRFSVTSFWDEIFESKAQTVYLVGPMLPLLSQAPENPGMALTFGQLKSVMSAPCPEDVRAVFRERFGVEHVGGSGFGQTEICMPFMLPIREDSTAGTNGRLMPYFEVQIVGADDIPVENGAVGEVILRPKRPDIMFSGYWNRPEETASAFMNLWYHTGDLGKFDQNGYFYFVDRKKDYLRSRGENISSFELEEILSKHPGLSEIAVHAVPSEFAEDEVKITAVRRDGTTVTEAEIYEWAQARIPRFAWPRFIEFRKQLPRNPIGRVLKHELRADGVTPGTWDQRRQG
jgi:crotonobetaine/carnitine-CoA ligase